jgi:hypothetical protein
MKTLWIEFYNHALKEISLADLLLWKIKPIAGGKLGAHKEEGDTETELPYWQREKLIDLTDRAKLLSEQPMSYYGGRTVAGFSPEQSMAQNLARMRATGGSSLIRGAQGQVGDIIGGKYLTPDSNPWLKSYYEKAAETAMPQIDTAAVNAGRYGGGAWGQMRGRTAGELASGIYGKAYETERDRQMQATNMAVPLAREDYYDIGKLAAVGEEKQGMEQALIDAGVKKHEFQQMEPWQRLGMYRNLVTGDWGGATVSSSSKKSI